MRILLVGLGAVLLISSPALADDGLASLAGDWKFAVTGMKPDGDCTLHGDLRLRPGDSGALRCELTVHETCKRPVRTWDAVEPCEIARKFANVTIRGTGVTHLEHTPDTGERLAYNLDTFVLAFGRDQMTGRFRGAHDAHAKFDKVKDQ